MHEIRLNILDIGLFGTYSVKSYLESYVILSVDWLLTDCLYHDPLLLKVLYKDVKKQQIPYINYSYIRWTIVLIRQVDEDF